MRYRRRSLIPVAVSLTSLLVASLVGWWAWSQHLALQQSRRREVSLSHALKNLRAQLADVTKKNADTIAALNKQVTDLTAQSASLQSSLDGRNGDVKTLKTCVDGISRAIVQATGGDASGAQATLNSVSDACTAAERIG